MIFSCSGFHHSAKLRLCGRVALHNAAAASVYKLFEGCEAVALFLVGFQVALCVLFRSGVHRGKCKNKGSVILGADLLHKLLELFVLSVAEGVKGYILRKNAAAAAAERDFKNRVCKGVRRNISRKSVYIKAVFAGGNLRKLIDHAAAAVVVAARHKVARQGYSGFEMTFYLVNVLKNHRIFSFR